MKSWESHAPRVQVPSCAPPDLTGIDLQGYEQLRENIIFLVDASPAMQTQTQGAVPEVLAAQQEDPLECKQDRGC